MSAHLTGKANTLADELSLPENLTEDNLYRAMRWFGERQERNQERIQQRLVKRHLSEDTLILYDLSSSYYEGSSCPLAAQGHNRDQKRGKTQIN